MCLLCYSSTFTVSDDSLVMPRSLQANASSMTFPAGLTSALTDVQEETGAFSVVTVGKEGWRVVGGRGGREGGAAVPLQLQCG